MVELVFGLGERSNSKENKIILSDDNLTKFDYLIFCDSRGLSTNELTDDSTIIKNIENQLSELDLSYLIISRPKNLTVFATLYNFLKLNQNIKFDNLITNIGFVDCTPKKIDNIEDILTQINQFSRNKNLIVEHENYMLSDNTSTLLKSIEYSDEYLFEINDFFNKIFKKIYYVNTPLIVNNEGIERERPTSFFKQLNKTNELLSFIVNLNNKSNFLINVENDNFTFDGVHFTKMGHQEIFSKIKGSLNI